MSTTAAIARERATFDALLVRADQLLAERDVPELRTMRTVMALDEAQRLHQACNVLDAAIRLASRRDVAPGGDYDEAMRVAAQVYPGVVAVVPQPAAAPGAQAPQRLPPRPPTPPLRPGIPGSHAAAPRPSSLGGLKRGAEAPAPDPDIPDFDPPGPILNGKHNRAVATGADAIDDEIPW